ncbi:MAG: isoleucine--tRNA ligase [Candidatus Omnitrophota bacterium]
MDKIGYKDTLNLPRASFSMKANLPQKEPEMLREWGERDIYGQILKKRKNARKNFILHDGPPYANGHIHMGHVLNKILKDMSVKYFTMKGFFTPFVPGWDCHGLPVEHQLFKELNITKHEIDQATFRKKARKYAMKYVGIQSKEFERLGIFGDWKKPYLTIDRAYEAEILAGLADLYEKGYIYKDLKPVNWCRKCETALAEAEVEYEDKASPSVYVKFKVDGDKKEGSTYFVIWTTTPWTLLANTAVALHPEFMYSVLTSGSENWIMAEELAEPLMKKFGVKNYKETRKISGKTLSEKIQKVKHPFLERESRVVLADYVTKEEGTGCVHTAPGHGQEDYLTGKKYGLPMIMQVAPNGNFTGEAGEFSGQNVLEANGAIIQKMRDNGSLILDEEVIHSYPHCWRCKEPIIFRATRQWFMNIGHQGLREKMLSSICKDVEWIPRVAEERIGSMIETRPDWCLSRQRYWGVPIPAFRCVSCEESFTTSDVIRKVSNLTRDFGADVWFEKPAGEFLPKNAICGKCGGKEFEKEEDILDVWFDSGVSHKAVLETREGLSFPADLYLEGSDQHRGWFQSSLITSMAIKGRAPYKKVLTHGFVVDGEGKKMSKSEGNVIGPQDVMKKYGADILRLWVSSSDYEGDIKLSPEILERLADGYRKIRNTFKFLLSNLYDFDISSNSRPVKGLEETDKWMLSRLYGMVQEINGYYEKWEFHKVYRAVYNFCVYEISAFYLDVAKDVLYVESSDSSQRRSAQTVIFNILDVLVRITAPILSFTAEEAWGFIEYKGKETSVHMADWPDVTGDLKLWKNEALDAKWKTILALRDNVMKFLELKRSEGLIKSSLESAVEFYSDKEDIRTFIRENIKLFPGLFKVSQASLMDTSDNEFKDIPELCIKIKITKAAGKKCQRCWNFSENVGKDKDFPDICERCFSVIQERSRHG